MEKKTKIIIGSILSIVILVISASIFVTYMVNSGKTKTSSETENNFYELLEEVEEMEKEESNKPITYKILNTVFGIKETHADQNFGLTPLKFNDRINTILEKYYVLSKFNVKTQIPKEIFIYGITHFNEFPKILNAYDYLNGTHTLKDFIKYKKEYSNKIFYKETIKQDLNIIIENYYKNKNSKETINFFPKEISNDEGFKFMIDGLKNHKYLISTSKQLGKELDFDYKLTLASILTEQFRYAGTYRGYIKGYLKQTPFIFSMTQWSYGVGGIKEFTGTKIKEDAGIYGNNKVFIAEKSDIYKDMEMKDLLQNKYWETVYPNILISNILNRWEKAGYSIENKPGIVITLYNFGNSSNKKPHGNPKVGGAVIKIHGKEYTFGGLGESLYYYIKAYGLYK